MWDNDLLRISNPALKWGRFSSDLNNKNNVIFCSSSCSRVTGSPRNVLPPHNTLGRMSFGLMKGAFWSPTLHWSAIWWFYDWSTACCIWNSVAADQAELMLTLVQHENHQLVLMLWLIGSCSQKKRNTAPLWNIKKAQREVICVALRTKRKIRNESVCDNSNLGLLFILVSFDLSPRVLKLEGGVKEKQERERKVVRSTTV